MSREGEGSPGGIIEGFSRVEAIKRKVKSEEKGGGEGENEDDKR